MSLDEEDSLAASLRDESPASNLGTENGSDYPDSGVVLNGIRGGQGQLGSRARPLALAPPTNGTYLAELRRPSIVDMMNTGGLVINPRGSCEINLEHVRAEDVEMMYALHGNGRRGSQTSMEDSSENQQSTEEGSLQQLTDSTTECCCHRSNWLNPRFESPILEKHWQKKVIEFLRRRFRIAVMFIGLFSLLWIVFFSVHLGFDPPANSSEAAGRSNELAANSVRYSWWYIVGGAILFVSVAILLVLTFSEYYSMLALPLSLLLSLLLMSASCALVSALHFDSTVQTGESTISFVSQFAISAVVILVIFTLSRLPMWLAILLSVVYLFVLETLAGLVTHAQQSEETSQYVFIVSTIARVLFHICLVLAGASTAYLSQVRLRATFWKIAQCVLSQKVLDLERELEEKTILSMMPKPFADELMNLKVQLMFMVKQNMGLEQEEMDPALQSLATPFAICSMDRVSILFADIVDFTEFSSSLTAAELVGILNDIFSTFDNLITKHKCEKISMLGDCYFCVSGCPEAITNHADNCVDMGLAIFDALDEFRRRTGYPLEMRIGIHTGSVFCGVMGTKKFKFDVWSRDVNIANQIESCGTPGRVLISAATRNFLSSAYVIEDANIHHRSKGLDGMQLYYVVGRRNRALSVGTSVVEWRRKIKQIDTTHRPESEMEDPPSSSPTCSHCLHLPWRKKKMTLPKKTLHDDQESTSSIVDIFSRQTQLQRYTSYAEELASPQMHQQVIFDRKIVELMEEQNVNFDTYFDPQLKLFSLQFHDHDWETTYRNYGRDLDDGSDAELTETALGFRITKMGFTVDTVTLIIIHILIMIGSGICLSSSSSFRSTLMPSWLGVFLVGLITDLVILVFVLAVMLPHWFPTWFAQRAQLIINWYVRTLVSLFLIYYPMTVVVISIGQCDSSGVEDLAHIQMSFFVTIVVMVCSINFMEVSHIVKLIAGFLSAVTTIIMVVVIHLNLCTNQIQEDGNTTVTTSDNGPTYEPDTAEDYLRNYYTRHVAPEAIILLLLILLILAVVNRMSEVSVRLSFMSRIEAAARKRNTRQQKTQAEWLLFNIIPPHVVFELRKRGTYSQNHECVGVIFASIVNFSDFYLQQRDGGEESLRLLNRIVSEFDALLDKPRFGHVEKIKTIGSTYMAASGLNLPSNQPCTPNHLIELIDFSQQLIEILEAINSQMPSFVFKMRIGFNYGPVTSGVVGSRKMLYDIWGDTVNVASRMESTGQVDKVHMPEFCLRYLDPYVNKEISKAVHVKGKGEMRTVFATLSRTSHL